MERPSHDWQHEPLEETLDGARRLTVSIVDELARDGWEQLAGLAAIPGRRWRRHHPVGDGPLIELVGGRPAFDAAAWRRFASLVPGAVALPTRTAAMLGVAPADLRPPGRAPLRIVDLWRARRLRARLRRAERSFAADLAATHARVRDSLQEVLAPGDDGTPFEQLPAYALAARLEVAMHAGRGWRVPVAIDLANGDATARLLRRLRDEGRAPGDALLELARVTRAGVLARPPHLDELDELAQLGPARRDAALEQWMAGLDGWHAMRALLVESPPLRASADSVRALLDRATARHEPAAEDPGDGPRGAAIARARALVVLREQAAHVRADLHAALRALTQTLARRLEADGVLERADVAFDLAWRDLLRLARGVATSEAAVVPEVATGAPAVAAAAPTDAADDGHGDTPELVPELRGIPASAGVGHGPVVVLEAATLDAPVEDAVLVCRVTDPAWLPLMLRCAALVTERGGPLSHAAIVARELGLPAVVGAAGARAAARAASQAHVDGGAGLVRFE